MVKFLLWLLLFIVCWPLAVLALLLYPFVWILLLPFRLLGIVVDGVFDFLSARIRLPASSRRQPLARGRGAGSILHTSPTWRSPWRRPE